MVKVLVQINSLALGGTQINAVDLAAELKKFGFESVLVGPRDTIPDGPSLFEIAQERGVEVEVFDRPSTTLRGAVTMSRLARRHGAAMVHVYGSWTARPAWWGPCFGGRRPLALTIYEMAVDPQTPKSPALIVGTRYLLEELADRRSGVKLISPPVDTDRDDGTTVDPRDFLDGHGIAPDRLRIVMVSRLDEDMKARGVEHAIAAADRIADSGIVLVIVGAGDAFARLERQAVAVNQRHRRQVVVMAGPLADPRPAYSAADVVIGMGGSAARALSFGKPLIVAGEFGWYTTFTEQNADELFRNSFWSDSIMDAPVDRLVSSLEDLLSDPEKRDALGTYGRDFAVGRFGLRAMAAELADVYVLSLKQFGFLVWSRDLSTEMSSFLHRIGATMEAVLRGGKRLGVSTHVATMNTGGKK